MKKPLSQKYKPSSLAEFKMDDRMRRVLMNMLKSGTMNIMLTGAPGTGKSCLTNLLIQEYYKGDTKDNILVLNNLKEQGIQYYRTDVKYFCQTTCVGRKKLIVVDDIDLVSEQNQQLFVNYVNKYPLVNFIVAGTNTQKIIDGVQSRLVAFRLNALEQADLMDLIERVSAGEGITIDDSAKEIVLSISNGSVRMLIHNLEKFKLLGKNVTRDVVDATCTCIRFTVLSEYTDAVLAQQFHKASKMMYAIYCEGYSGIDILDNYFLFLKVSRIQDAVKYEFVKVLCKYIAVFNQLHEHHVELLFFTLDLCNAARED